MMTLLTATVLVLDWDGYCALTLDKKLLWEERGDELNKAMLYLMSLKNEHAKKDLRLVYSQRNIMAYPSTIEGMARYLLTQYPNNKPANQRNGKKGDKIREVIQNPKTRTITRVTLQVHTLEIPKQLKNQPLLAEEIVLALTFLKQMNSRPVHHVLWRRF